MWEDVFQAAKGSTLRIRLPANYKSEPVAEAAPLMRYDAVYDEVIPVTKEWVDEITEGERELRLELKAARDEIQRLSLLQSSRPDLLAEKSEQDRIWHALRMAAVG